MNKFPAHLALRLKNSSISLLSDSLLDPNEFSSDESLDESEFIIIIIVNIIYSWCNLVQGTNSFQLKNKILNNIIHVLLINIQKIYYMHSL